MAEALGVREVLSWLKQHFAITSIIIEINNLLVKLAPERDYGNNYYFDVISHDCKTLTCGFTSVFVFR